MRTIKRDPGRYQYFAQTFDEGRDWFRGIASAKGAQLDAATHPSAVGPAGERLSTDVAWFGPRSASRVFVAISGTHGQEYFCGAAAQLGWMSSDGPERLPDDVAVCLVHAHNPFGAAHLSRGNENFVDLNRNYLDEPLAVRPNPLYGELFDLLFTHDLDEHVLDEVMDAFYDFVSRQDPKAAMTAMGGGQSTHPTGTLYCGRQLEWSTVNLKQLVRGSLDRAERLVLTDWHTGVGRFGEAMLMTEHPTTSIAAVKVREWLGHFATGGDLRNEAAPDFVGQACAGMAAELRGRGAEVVDTVVEIGTFENRGVLAALLIDRWLRFECEDREAPRAVALQTRMLERLNPSLPEWRSKALVASRGVYESCLAGLAAWR